MQHHKPYLSRIFLDIATDGVTTYTVQTRATEGDDWEAVIFPSNLTEAVYLYRDAAEDHLKALRKGE